MLKTLILIFRILFCSFFMAEIGALVFINSIIYFNYVNFAFYGSYIDYLSLNLVLLTIIIIIFCILTNTLLNKSFIYISRLSSLLFLLILSFFCKSILGFFILFESSLVPLYILILGWGYQPERLQASFYFLFYTLFGSLPLLINLFFLSKNNYNLDWINRIFLINLLFYLFIILAFLIKMPMFLVHLWLPKAHVEAPVVGSMILAGITLKLGRYALLRVCNKTRLYILKYNWVWIRISIIGNIILCLVCLRQRDIKALIAYSSVVHMGLCLISIFFLYNWSYEGALWLSLSHGLASSGLFYLTNTVYIRSNRRRIFINKGLSLSLPTIRVWWFLLLIFNMAAPPSLNLFREIKMVTVTLQFSYIIIILTVVRSFFCGAYCIFLYSVVNHGLRIRNLKQTNNLILIEHFVRFIHLFPLLISILCLNFIQWIYYLYSLIKIMICGIIVVYKS